jgi:hypothetical protein
LTGGILDSEWCIKELRSAIKSKKEIVVIRDVSYRLPDLFPMHLLDIEDIIRNSKTLVWVAEYNTACVERLKSEVLGPSDAIIASIDEWMNQPENAVEAKQIRAADLGEGGSLNLSNWSGDVEDFLSAYVEIW